MSDYIYNLFLKYGMDPEAATLRGTLLIRNNKALLMHPDKGKQTSGSTAKMQELNSNYAEMKESISARDTFIIYEEDDGEGVYTYGYNAYIGD
jgi:hypothetical protein